MTHAEQDYLEYLSNAPTAYVNGVTYVLDYGEGWSVERTLWGTVETCPVWVWRARAALDYTAPPHVSDACFANYALGEEMRQAERAAGWPSP